MLSDRLSARRWQLCGRANADRLAQRMCETAEIGFAVVRTKCRLQPYKVVRSEEGDPHNIELEVVVL